MNIEYYQNLNMPSDEAFEKKNRRKSKYWNEGKWRYFIAPLLPGDCRDMTFVDVGCNAGLFCKLAKDWGFRDVIGIEKSRKACQRAIKYRDHIGYDYKILHQTIGVNFSFNQMPVADVTLLANVHYYLQLNDWLKYLDQLQYKTVYCLIISRSVREKHHWRPKTRIADIKWYFRNWEGVGAIYRPRYEWRERNDPSPRELWSFLFKSKFLNRRKFNELHAGAPAESMKLPRDELIKEINEKGYQKLEIEETSYFKVWKQRMKNHWPEAKIWKFVAEKVALMVDIQKNGMVDPILVQLDNKIIDGGHRVAILKGLGYQSIITRTI